MVTDGKEEKLKKEKKVINFVGKGGMDGGSTEVQNKSYKTDPRVPENLTTRDEDLLLKDSAFVLTRTKWQSKMAFHPTYGPCLVTKVPNDYAVTIEILSDDYKETLFKKEVPLSDLFYNFTFLNKVLYAFKRFFVVMGKRTFVDHYFEGADKKGRG